MKSLILILLTLSLSAAAFAVGEEDGGDQADASRCDVSVAPGTGEPTGGSGEGAAAPAAGTR